MSKTLPGLPVLPSRYRLWPSPERAHLGTGGAATVWRVQDEALGVLVAFKALKSTSPGFLSRLEREAVLASRVVHPNVIALHDVGRTPDGKGYLAFALASDGSMLDLAVEPPPWPELLDLTIQLLEALAALHARGILHLDIKLSNLLLHRTPKKARELWLADLGVARALHGEDDHDRSVVGTVSYMPPERLTGQHNLWCPSSDLFSVGAVLYRLLTGELPYPAKEPAAALAEREKPPQTLNIRRNYPVPPGLDAVILPMLEPDHRARFDLAADVIRAFRHLPLLPGSPEAAVVRVGARPDDPAGRPPRRPPEGVPAWNRPPPMPPPARLPMPAVSVRRIPQAPSLLTHREVQLVGRTAELDQLWRTARTVMKTRRPILVEVTGEEGSGRSRLVMDFVRALEQAGTAEGVVCEYGVANGPDAGLRGAFRRLLRPGDHRDLYLEDLGMLLARDRQVEFEVAEPDARRIAALLAPTPEDAPVRRSALQGILVEHIERRAWRGLSFLWVEDADLAGENDDCWEIMNQLLSRSAPVIILATTRRDRPSASLLELRARHHRVVRTIDLDPLPPRSAEELVQTQLPLEPELSRQLARRTGGRPRLMHEILCHWIRARTLEEVNLAEAPVRYWRLPGGEIHIPADPATFARERLAVAGPQLASAYALRALALCQPGVPEEVISRIDAEGLDRLVVEGLVELRQGQVGLNPPALADVVRKEIPTNQAVFLHSALANSWESQGSDPAANARVGHHWQGAGRPDLALPALERALRGLAHSLPVPALIELAQATVAAAEAVGQAGGPSWCLAADHLADALWRAERDGEARGFERRTVKIERPPHLRAAAQAARLIRDPAETHALDQVELLLGQIGLSAEIQASLLLARARVHAAGLRHAEALADLLDALVLRPSPPVEAAIRLLRARLLSTADAMVAWYESLRVVELARDHGLLRFEVLAWGLAGEALVFLGRAEEAVERVKAGVARLEAHGEWRAAEEARIHLGRVLRAAGRTEAARVAFEGVGTTLDPGSATCPLGGALNLATLAVLDGRPVPLLPACPRDPGEALACRLLGALAELDGPLPDPEELEGVLCLGVDGLFLALALVDRVGRIGRREEAVVLLEALQSACHAAGIDTAEADALMERTRRQAS